MAKIERILILAKTYPSPSAQYVETSCVAGINEQGEMRRIYPVPFRYIDQGQQFKKWQWIDARVRKSKNDHRAESHRIDVDTIKCGSCIATKNGWAGRREWVDRIPSFDKFEDIEKWRVANGGTLALLRPQNIIGMDIVKAKNPSWTDEERDKLLREQMQGNLFDEIEEKRKIRELRKIPFDFYYKLADTRDSTPQGTPSQRNVVEAEHMFGRRFPASPDNPMEEFPPPRAGNHFAFAYRAFSAVADGLEHFLWMPWGRIPLQQAVALGDIRLHPIGGDNDFPVPDTVKRVKSRPLQPNDPGHACEQIKQVMQRQLPLHRKNNEKQQCKDNEKVCRKYADKRPPPPSCHLVAFCEHP